MTMTQDERISRLEGAFETFSVMSATMVTKVELWASVDGLRAEQRASVETLRAENQATAETLRAEIRTAELRIIRWMVGTVFAASGLVLAVTKLWQ